MGIETVGSPLLWAGFLVFVVAMLALDLGVFHRRSHAIGLREAAAWTAVWVALAALFGVGVYVMFGAQTALEFATGYLIEKALSVDNIFVFLVLFSYFSVPARHQHRVLFWGILGALVTRAIFIVAGGALLAHFHFAIYVFGLILALTGLKLLLRREEEVHPERNAVVRLFRRFVPIAEGHRDGQFLVREGGRLLATPLLVALVAVEATDIVFAVDSIPAIFAVTMDPFIVFTSNIFAILGLRSLYFLLAGVMDRFHYLKVGLALILVFVGAKMLLSGVLKVPIVVSLGVIAGLLVASILASWIWPVREPVEPGAADVGA